MYRFTIQFKFYHKNPYSHLNCIQNFKQKDFKLTKNPNKLLTINLNKAKTIKSIKIPSSKQVAHVITLNENAQFLKAIDSFNVVTLGFQLLEQIVSFFQRIFSNSSRSFADSDD